MWWLDPRDEATFTIHDQFALGDDLIVAPVVERGATTRDIYLTQGRWRDPFDEVTPVTAACTACADAILQTTTLLPPAFADSYCMLKATAQHRLSLLIGQMLPLLDAALADVEWDAVACRRRIRHGRAPAGCRASLRP